MAKESLHQLKADLKAARAEIDGLMQERSLTREQHEHDIRAARAEEHQKIVTLSCIIEALGQLLKVSYLGCTK